MPDGLFIVLDGPDGCGKSTQAALLVAKLRKLGRDTLHLRDPGGTDAGEQIRKVLLDPSISLGTTAEVFLFMASRAQLAEEVILPALAAKKVVVCERWVSSTVAYQGAAGRFGIEKVLNLSLYAIGTLRPNLLVLLDVSPEVGLARVKRNLDRMERKSGDYHRSVRKAFVDAASPKAAEELLQQLVAQQPAGTSSAELKRNAESWAHQLIQLARIHADRKLPESERLLELARTLLQREAEMRNAPKELEHVREGFLALAWWRQVFPNIAIVNAEMTEGLVAEALWSEVQGYL